MATNQRRTLPVSDRTRRVYPRTAQWVRIEQHRQGDDVRHYGIHASGMRIITTPVVWQFNELNQR